VNGQEQWITIPLVGASMNKNINEIKICPQEKWLPKMRRTLEYAYSKAPYYNQVMELMNPIFKYNEKSLADFVANSIMLVSTYLQLDSVIENASEDHIKRNMQGTDRIISICKKENATHYVNLPGGRELYKYDIFKNEGIELCFVDSNENELENELGKSVFSLSILHSLFHNSKESIQSSLII